MSIDPNEFVMLKKLVEDLSKEVFDLKDDNARLWGVINKAVGYGPHTEVTDILLGAIA